MVDLKRQYQNIQTEIDAAIKEVMDSAAFINGPVVKEFTDKLAAYTKAKHVIPCANGTDALQIALMALDLQPGDEVITPSFTFIATVEVVALLGLTPVFVDVDPDTFTVNIESVQQAITPKTKVIIPVHLYGQCSNMEPIMELAQANNIAVIEDNAQSIGGHYVGLDGMHKTGTMGTISSISFFPSKNLGAYGDGGVIMTNSDELASKMLKICNHGSEKRYYHEIVGVNSRLDSIQAAVLKVKLKYLDQYCDKRRAVAAFYNRVLGNHPHLRTPFEPAYSHHVYHQYTLILEGIDRDAVHEALAKRGVPTMIYYPVPCHQQEMFKNLQDRSYDLPHTEYLVSKVLSLPIHTELTEEEMTFITTQLLEVIDEVKQKYYI
ncbi:DegT/DnrJ/EryC1/StrS family aminotransferase [Myroides sp. 1354]|nr:DegT/DnrJ/EryC1/StrS family aminotransferase [Myroides sp. R163-1]MDM1057141.1 DegT/DnrJ/EryC1/StrS family aminotransferase [Myroides sp. 1354]MDM1070336.1 DegT/DnrJ/EryC1/StrS family aminotransferase [Myroides sp. 1372]